MASRDVQRLTTYVARAWTRNELIVAMNLYSRLTFGQLHARNPLITATAARMDRSPGSVAMKLCNPHRRGAVASRGRATPASRCPAFAHGPRVAAPPLAWDCGAPPDAGGQKKGSRG